MIVIDPPAEIEGPAAWTPSDLEAHRAQWQFTISEAELQELEATLEKARHADKNLGDLGPEDLPLHELGERLAGFAPDLDEGWGLLHLTGLDLAGWSLQDAATAMWAITILLGLPVAQNAAGEVLTSIRDQRQTLTPAGPAAFHSAWGDVAALMCVQRPTSGGAFTLASSARVHNLMLQADPDLLRQLFQPMPGTYYAPGVEYVPGTPFHYTAPFSYFGGCLSVHWPPATATVAEQHPEVGRALPDLTLATDLFERLAFESQMRIELAEGDLLLINNHAVVHSRDPFIDHPELAQRRHLLRMYLARHNGRRLATNYASANGALDGWGARGGVANARAPVAL